MYYYLKFFDIFKSRCCFLPQNYAEEMERSKENKAWKDWDLESTAQLLAKRFPRSFIWVVRTAFFDRATFACYSNFIEMDACGTPVFERADSTALLHLQNLLDSAVRTGNSS